MNAEEEMSQEEFVDFLKSLLIKIENAINLIEQDVPKHIPSYRKMLGVQQKISQLYIDDRNRLFSQIVKVRGIINYFLNGRYEEAYSGIIELKKNLVNICLEKMKNERDTDK